jgi:hypothetical protein
MLHDIVRAALIVAVLAASCSLLVETRQRLTMLDIAAKIAANQSHANVQTYASPQQPEPGRLRRFGQSALNMADAALNVIR